MCGSPQSATGVCREVHLTEQGRILVEASNTQRNAWLAQIVEGVPARKRMLVSEALELLSNATADITVKQP